MAVCIEAEVSVGAVSAAEIGNEVRIAFGAVPFGYGWVFPKSDHWSVGVGGLGERIVNPRLA